MKIKDFNKIKRFLVSLSVILRAKSLNICRDDYYFDSNFTLTLSNHCDGGYLNISSDEKHYIIITGLS
jgi:hypothetical protein